MATTSKVIHTAASKWCQQRFVNKNLVVPAIDTAGMLAYRANQTAEEVGTQDSTCYTNGPLQQFALLTCHIPINIDTKCLGSFMYSSMNKGTCK